jgi:hypothetical protein
MITPLRSRSASSPSHRALIRHRSVSLSFRFYLSLNSLCMPNKMCLRFTFLSVCHLSYVCVLCAWLWTGENLQEKTQRSFPHGASQSRTSPAFNDNRIVLLYCFIMANVRVSDGWAASKILPFVSFSEKKYSYLRIILIIWERTANN